MYMVHITKFSGQTHEASYTVPAFLVRFADKVLPRAAISALAGQGIDIPAIAEARRKGNAYSRSFDVVERGISKRVFVSLER
ncbi:hypothetical protein [Pelagibacterium limicola]|uniref:hypothetical protein n=1 Tax=Pelagibacterium limicola TaxID=2791022 RepID=UPI0018AF7778|nr:hypothetical protein [Pelagibacterium limicola]